MLKLVIIALLVTSTLAAEEGIKCRQILRKAGFSDNFNETIAHAIHSMTVEGLQAFNPRANEDNRVPTVNMDRKSSRKVIPFAPDYALGSDFETSMMNLVDKILSNIGEDNDGLGPNWSPVERIVHALHMRDLWERIHEVYTTKTLINPPRDVICDCLVDTLNNGIFEAVDWISKHYDVGTPITLLNRPIPKLTDASSWEIWKYRLLYYYTSGGVTDAANYIYCATKDF